MGALLMEPPPGGKKKADAFICSTRANRGFPARVVQVDFINHEIENAPEKTRSTQSPLGLGQSLESRKDCQAVCFNPKRAPYALDDLLYKKLF
jgi:hypothetical protein